MESFNDGLGAASLVVTTVLAIFIYLKDRKKVDVDADTAVAATELSADEQSVRHALLLRDAALSDRAAMRTEMNEFKQVVEENQRVQDEKINILSTEVHTVKSQLNHTRRIWSAWAQDLHDRWDHHRQQVFPPALPSDTYADIEEG